MDFKVFPWVGDIPGYGAARWDGFYAVSIPMTPFVETLIGPIPQPPGAPARFLALPALGSRIACGAQGNNHAWEWADGGWQDRGATCGNNPVIYARNDLLAVADAKCKGSTGALGWRYLRADGVLVSAESTYADKFRKIWQYTDFGDVAIGEGSPTGVLIRFKGEPFNRCLILPDPKSTPAKPLPPILDQNSDAKFIKVSKNGSKVAITAVCLREHKTVIVWATLAELGLMPNLDDLPIEVPEEEPPVPVPIYPSKLVVAFSEKFPLPQQTGSTTLPQHEENCRKWTYKLAEYLCFKEGLKWGAKARSASGTTSKDTLGYNPMDGSKRLWGFDVMIGAGTGHPTLKVTSTPIDISNQAVIPVSPIDWLGSASIPTEPEPEPVPDLTPRVKALEDLTKSLVAQQNALITTLNDLKARVERAEARIEQVDLKFGKLYVPDTATESRGFGPLSHFHPVKGQKVQIKD